MFKHYINILNQTQFQGSDKPVNHKEVISILANWKSQLEHPESANFADHANLVTWCLNGISGLKPKSVGSESFYLPFEHGFDTMVAVIAYYKAHIGSVRPFKQQGI